LAASVLFVFEGGVMTDEHLLWLVGAHVIGFWALMFYMFRLKKRMRCLGYCYIDIGDWGIGKLIETKEYYISSHGEHVTPFLLLEAEEQFQHKLTHHRKMFGEIGLTPPGLREQYYILEGL
jgi:hypothetical protein